MLLLAGLLVYPTTALAQSVEPEPAATSEEESAIDFVYTHDDLSVVDLLDLEVVTASGSSEAVAQAPGVIDVISSQEIDAFGFRTLGEALDHVAGLDVLSDQYQYNLGVRGVSSGQRGWSRIVKVMIDGQPIAFRSTGENFLGIEAIPLSAVERIEVVRGPASVLYGANAFLGVINVITKQGYQVDGAQIRTRYEGSGRVQHPAGEFVVGGDFDRFSFLATAGAESSRFFNYQLVPLPNQSRPSDDWSQTQHAPAASAFARIVYRPTRAVEIHWDGHFQNLSRDAEFMDWGPMAHDNRMQLMNGFTRLALETQWDKRLFLRVAAALAWGGVGPQDRLNLASDLTTHIERDMGYQGRDLEAQLRYELGGNSQVSIGVDGSFDTQTLLTHYTVVANGTRIKNPPARSESGKKAFVDAGAYANATIYPFELLHLDDLAHLGIVGGARVDAHNIYGDNENFRGGLLYDFNRKHYVKLLFGTSFRAPSPSQLFSNYVEPGGIIGNPELRPERARTLEAAVGVSPLRGLTARANVYYTRIADRVEIRQPPPASTLLNEAPVNSTPINSFGGELELDYTYRRYAFYANYSFQRSSYEKANLGSINQELVHVQTDAYPAHLIKFGAAGKMPSYHLRWSFDGKWVGRRLGSLQNNALVQGPRVLTERYALSPYLIMDLGLFTHGLEFWGHRETIIGSRIRNLLDKQYVLPGYGGFDIPAVGRTFEISLSQEF